MDEPLMRVRTGTSGEHAVLTVEGELDISTLASLQEAIAATAGPTGRIIDLSAVSFMGSSSLRLLLSGGGTAQVLVAPPGSAAFRLIELLSLVDSVPLVSAVSEAVTLLDTGTGDT